MRFFLEWIISVSWTNSWLFFILIIIIVVVVASAVAFFIILNGTFSFCYLTIPELITMITDSCSCLSLSASLFTLLTLLSSVSASDSPLLLLLHAIVVIHTEGKICERIRRWEISHCFPMIMIFRLLSSLRSLCVSYHDGNILAL